jgi:hypothetical protein
MPIDYSGFALPKVKPTDKPKPLRKQAKQTEHDRKLQAAYRKVEKRENNRCQVTGVELTPFHRDERRCREHHHIKGRNVKPEWVYEPKRIVLCSKKIHDMFTANVLEVIGTDASSVKFAWNRNIVRPGKEPMRLERVA